MEWRGEHLAHTLGKGSPGDSDWSLLSAFRTIDPGRCWPLSWGLIMKQIPDRY